MYIEIDEMDFWPWDKGVNVYLHIKDMIAVVFKHGDRIEITNIKLVEPKS